MLICLVVGKLLFTFVQTFLMKSKQLLKILLANGWYVVSQEGSHKKLKHPEVKEIIIFPDHGSQELGKGLEQKIRKIAGLK